MAFWVIAVFAAITSRNAGHHQLPRRHDRATSFVDFATSGVWEAPSESRLISPDRAVWNSARAPGSRLTGGGRGAGDRSRPQAVDDGRGGCSVVCVDGHEPDPVASGWRGRGFARRLLIGNSDLRKRLLAVFRTRPVGSGIDRSASRGRYAVDSPSSITRRLPGDLHPTAIIRASPDPSRYRRQVESAAVIQEILLQFLSSRPDSVLSRSVPPATGSPITTSVPPTSFGSYLAIWFRMGIKGLIAIVWLAGKYPGRSGWNAIGLLAIGCRSASPCSYLAILVYSVTADSVFRHPMDLFAALALVGGTLSVEAHAVRENLMEPKVRNRDIAITRDQPLASPAYSSVAY